MWLIEAQNNEELIDIGINPGDQLTVAKDNIYFDENEEDIQNDLYNYNGKFFE